MRVSTIFLLDSDVISDLLGLRRETGWLVVERPDAGPDQFFVTGAQKREGAKLDATEWHRAVRLEVTALQRRKPVGAPAEGQVRPAAPEPDPNVLASRAAAKGAHDVLIATTAAVRGAVLVTRDRALIERGTTAGVTVWDPESLTIYLTRSQLPARQHRWPANAGKVDRRSLRPTGS